MKKSLVILSVFAVGISYGQKSTEAPVFTTEKQKSEWIEKTHPAWHGANNLRSSRRPTQPGSNVRTSHDAKRDPTGPWYPATARLRTQNMYPGRSRLHRSTRL